MNPTVRDLIVSDDIRHDPWGTALSHQFGIAYALYHVGEHVPSEWEFSPGIATMDLETEEYPDCEYIALLQSGQVRPGELRQAGSVLARYVAHCAALGKDY